MKMTEEVKRPFTAEETSRMKDELVFRVGAIYELRSRKKAMTSAIASEILTAEKACSDLQQKLALGYELEEMEIGVTFDEPSVGEKTVFVASSGKPIRVEKMTPGELQRQLFDREDLDEDSES
ncbi:MAG TPA: hypothetical protein VFV58_39270 [Blastocatellia bacterium]|jgi:hypothetical protein|nr:hypothetical protein [Blastocatellia bacterium]